MVYNSLIIKKWSENIRKVVLSVDENNKYEINRELIKHNRNKVIDGQRIYSIIDPAERNPDSL